MNTFEELLNLNSIELQKTISVITDNILLGTALKSGSNELKEKFYNAMPALRKEMVEEVLKYVQADNLQIQKAQEKIVDIACKRLNLK